MFTVRPMEVAVLIASAASSTLTSPLAYPFEIWPTSFVLSGGSAFSVPIASIPLEELASFEQVGRCFAEATVAHAVREALNLRQPIAFLSSGSNASPRRMAEKLARSSSSRAIGVRVATRRYTPVYAAALSYYGSIPATFGQGDALAFPFLMMTEASNLDSITESETRTGNYDLYRSNEAAGIGLDLPVYAFLSRFGPLRIDSGDTPLIEFQQTGSAKGVTQRQVVERVLRVLGRDMDVQAYATALGDLEFRRTLREDIIARFAVPTTSPWFDRVG